MGNKSFTSDVLTLTSVPVISQILGILLTPIVTRLYAPEAFGLFNVLGSVVMIPAVLSTIGYHGAIILPKTDKTASNILLVCFFSVLIISVISFLIVTVGKDIITVKLNTPDLVHYLWMTPLFVLSHGMYQTLRFWNTRLRLFGNLSISRVTEMVFKKAYQIPAGFLGFATAGSLIFAGLTAAFAKNFILLKNADLGRISVNKKSYFNLWAVAKRYKKFPQYSVWSDLFSRIPAVIISLFIVKYFGPNMLGNYGLSLMILALPSTLISGSIIEAFIPRAAMAKHEGKLTELLDKLYVRLISIMIFPFMILGLFGDMLFPFMFGVKWVNAGIISQILVFRFFFEVTFSPFISLINILERQELNVIRRLANILITLVSLMFGIYYNNIFLALWILTFLESVLIIILGYFIMYLIKYPFLLTLKGLSRNLLFCMTLGIFLIFIEQLINLNDIVFLFVIILTLFTYFSFILYFDKEILKSVKNIFH